MTFLFIM